MKLLAALSCGLLFSFSALAQNLVRIDIKPPFTTPQCNTIERDTVGAIGLVTKQISASQDTNHVKLEVISSLFVCTITTDGSKKLTWKGVNPYAGFMVQYFDVDTSSIKTRKVFIDPAKTYNQMKIVGFFQISEPNEIKTEGPMAPSAEDSFSGSIMINKAGLFNQSDLENLASGQTVEKRIEIYQASNFTTFFGTEEIQLGDEARSGQNIFLYFSY